MKALFKAIMILSKLLSGTAGISFLEYPKPKNILGLSFYHEKRAELIKARLSFPSLPVFNVTIIAFRILFDKRFLQLSAKKSILIISREKKYHADNHSKYHFASSASSVTLGGFSLHHFSHASASEALNSFLLISFREIFHPNEVLNAI